MDSERIEETDAAVEAKFLREADEARLHMAFAVNVKLRAGNAASQFVEGAHRDVQSLVPLQAARKQDHGMAVGLGMRSGLKDARVHVVDEDRTFLRRSGAR